MLSRGLISVGAVGAGAFLMRPRTCAQVQRVSVRDECAAEKALSALKEDGAVIFQHAHHDSEKVRSTFASFDMPRSAFRQSSAGRYHLSLLGNHAAEESQVDGVWTQLNGPEQQLSMIHLLDSRPQSETQMLHRDNALGGLTVVIPLQNDVTLQNGPTMLLLGSHRGWIAGGFPARIAKPTLSTSAGEVLVYSSQTLHRGEANESDAPRPVAVFRYDRPDQPAPGQSILEAQLTALAATIQTM